MNDQSKQMYEDFQLVYNNLSSNLAPGLTLFEISMYLTKAYHSFVQQLYGSYEQNEMTRKALLPLVTSLTISSPSLVTGVDQYKINKDSILYQHPSDLLYIVFEEIKAGDDAPRCFRNKDILVVPVTHDDYFSRKDNPFQMNDGRILRLDTTINGVQYSEIIPPSYSIKKYFLRYIRKPNPIILDALTGTDKIDGLQAETNCELNQIYFPDIIRNAAKLAYQDYKTA